MPRVRRNGNTGTVSVTAPLLNAPPFKPVRLIAPKATWKKLAVRVLAGGPDALLSFNGDINPLLAKRTRPDQRTLLARYAAEDPEDFSWAMYCQFVEPVVVTFDAKRPRGRRPLGTTKTSDEIKLAASWLVVFLRYWAEKEEPSDYPKALRQCLRRLDLLLTPRTTMSIAYEIIAQHFKLAWTDSYDTDSFRRKHVYGPERLARIEKALDKVKHQPTFYPLATLLLLKP